MILQELLINFLKFHYNYLIIRDMGKAPTKKKALMTHSSTLPGYAFVLWLAGFEPSVSGRVYYILCCVGGNIGIRPSLYIRAGQYLLFFENRFFRPSYGIYR